MGNKSLLEHTLRLEENSAMNWPAILHVACLLVGFAGSAPAPASSAVQIATCIWNVHMSTLERFAQQPSQSVHVTYEEFEAARFFEQVSGLESPVRQDLGGVYVFGRRAIERWKLWYAFHGRTIYFDSTRGVVRSPRAVQPEDSPEVK